MSGLKNRSVLIAAAMALALPGAMGTVGAGQTGVQPHNAPQGSSGPAPQGGIGTLLNALAHSGGGSAGGWRPKYKKERGPGHLAAKRLKRRRRNQLRAKGQHRKAVR